MKRKQNYIAPSIRIYKLTEQESILAGSGGGSESGHITAPIGGTLRVRQTRFAPLQPSALSSEEKEENEEK